MLGVRAFSQLFNQSLAKEPTNGSVGEVTGSIAVSSTSVSNGSGGAGDSGALDSLAAGCATRGLIIQFWHMSQTITVRLTKELAAWLEQVAAKMGVSQGRIIRDELEKAKASTSSQAFMRLAGAVRGPKDLSSRKGFSRS